jgi:hypothetical protein
VISKKKKKLLPDSVCLSACRDLDPGLQSALRGYLVARGVTSKLAGSILRHLLEKERFQYVTWLKTLEETMAKDRWCFSINPLVSNNLSLPSQPRTHCSEYTWIALPRHSSENSIPFRRLTRIIPPMELLAFADRFVSRTHTSHGRRVVCVRVLPGGSCVLIESHGEPCVCVSWACLDGGRWC